MVELDHQVFTVTNTLLCEHVGLRVMTDHPLRGDVRITLVSPAGTGAFSSATMETPAPARRTGRNYSTHHFYESSAGNWQAYFSDEGQGNTGTVQSMSLIISGVQLSDTDHDGLPIRGKLTHFGDLTQGSNDDPITTADSNMREQHHGNESETRRAVAIGSVPMEREPRAVEWPGSPQFTYQVWGGTNVASLSLLATVGRGLPGNRVVLCLTTTCPVNFSGFARCRFREGLVDFLALVPARGL
jgi:subtilisin-like proprotein convertase family protein